jgi:hypothetical protein
MIHTNIDAAFVNPRDAIVARTFTTTPNIKLTAHDHSNPPSLSLHRLRLNSTSTRTPAPVVNPDLWTEQKGRRFKELSRKECLEELSAEELSELDTLTRIRRYAKYPRTAEEILFERGANNVTNSLLLAIQQYVKFFETKSHS